MKLFGFDSFHGMRHFRQIELDALAAGDALAFYEAMIRFQGCFYREMLALLAQFRELGLTDASRDIRSLKKDCLEMLKRISETRAILEGLR